MKVKFLFLSLTVLFSTAIFAQDIVEDKKSKKKQSTSKSSSLPTEKLDYLFGTTKLIAINKITDGTNFVDYLKANPNFTVEQRIEGDNYCFFYDYEKEDVEIVTKRTGFDLRSLDDYVYRIEIGERAGRKMPYETDCSMNFGEFKKALANRGFKMDRSKTKKIFGVYKIYTFERPNATVELSFEDGVFNEMTITANLNYMFGGQLIR